MEKEKNIMKKVKSNLKENIQREKYGMELEKTMNFYFWLSLEENFSTVKDGMEYYNSQMELNMKLRKESLK